MPLSELFYEPKSPAEFTVIRINKQTGIIWKICLSMHLVSTCYLCWAFIRCRYRQSNILPDLLEFWHTENMWLTDIDLRITRICGLWFDPLQDCCDPQFVNQIIFSRFLPSLPQKIRQFLDVYCRLLVVNININTLYLLLYYLLLPILFDSRLRMMFICALSIIQ